MTKKFTLIELLVVIAIISILASMLLPALGKAKLAARLVVVNNNVNQICISIAEYKNEWGDYPMRGQVGNSVLYPYLMDISLLVLHGTLSNINIEWQQPGTWPTCILQDPFRGVDVVADFGYQSDDQYIATPFGYGYLFIHEENRRRDWGDTRSPWKPDFVDSDTMEYFVIGVGPDSDSDMIRNYHPNQALSNDIIWNGMDGDMVWAGSGYSFNKVDP